MAALEVLIGNQRPYWRPLQAYYTRHATRRARSKKHYNGDKEINFNYSE